MSLTCDSCGSLLRPPGRVWTRDELFLYCDRCRGYEGGAGDGWRELDEAEIRRRAYELEQAEAEPVTRETQMRINAEVREGMHAMGLQTGYHSAEAPKPGQAAPARKRTPIKRLAPTVEEQRRARWLAMSPAERERVAAAEQARLEGKTKPALDETKAPPAKPVEPISVPIQEEPKTMAKNWTDEQKAKFRATMQEKRLAREAAKIRGEQAPAKQRAAVERIAPRQAAEPVDGLAGVLRRIETLAELDAEGRALLLWALRLDDEDRAALIEHIEGAA